MTVLKKEQAARKSPQDGDIVANRLKETRVTRVLEQVRETQTQEVHKRLGQSILGAVRSKGTTHLWETGANPVKEISACEKRFQSAGRELERI